MRSRKGLLRFLLVTMLFAGAATTGVMVWRAQLARTEWRAARPVRPDVSALPAPFGERLERVEASLDGWLPDLAALDELARLYLANGFEKEAETALRAALAYHPQNARNAHALAVLLAGYGRLDEAIELWERVASAAPDYFPAQIKRGDALLKTNRLDEASAVFEGVLTRKKAEPYALLGLARLEIERDRWSAARQRLEEAVAAEPSFSAAHSLLATVADRLGDATAAQYSRGRASFLGRYKDVPDPWSADLLTYCYDVYRLQVLASGLANTGSAQEALLPLQRAAELTPSDHTVRRQIGRVYLKIGDLERARQSFKEAIRLQPSDPVTYQDMVGVLRKTRAREEAKRWLSEGLRHCPNEASLHFEMAEALRAEGELETAVLHYSEARRLAPDNLTAYEELVGLFFRLERPDDAVAVMRAALERNGRHGAILSMMARYEIEQGERDQAEHFLRRAGDTDVAAETLEDLRRRFERTFGQSPR